MDTTEQYIRMCEKAEDIQGHQLEGGDFYARAGIGYAGEGWNVVKWSDQRHVSGGIGTTTEYIRHNRLDVTWLPRQDQLQEMVEGDWLEKLQKLMLPKVAWLRPSILTGFTSMEQLWLAFVEHELYNKVWDGEAWI